MRTETTWEKNSRGWYEWAIGGKIKYMIYTNENITVKLILLYSKCMLMHKRATQIGSLLMLDSPIRQENSLLC